MSASLRRERAWRYPAAELTGDDSQAATYAVQLADTPDGAVWCAYAAQAGRESVVALRRTAIGRATLTIADDVDAADSDLWRLQRTGTLYTVTGVQPVPAARETILTLETVERGQYAITVDVPDYTAANVLINPTSLNIGVGTKRYFRATVTNSEQRVLLFRPVRWTSSDPNVCLVYGTGQVEGVSSGTVTVTATSDDAVGTALVTVA